MGLLKNPCLKVFSKVLEYQQRDHSRTFSAQEHPKRNPVHKKPLLLAFNSIPHNKLLPQGQVVFSVLVSSQTSNQPLVYAHQIPPQPTFSARNQLSLLLKVNPRRSVRALVSVQEALVAAKLSSIRCRPPK